MKEVATRLEVGEEPRPNQKTGQLKVVVTLDIPPVLIKDLRRGDRPVFRPDNAAELLTTRCFNHKCGEMVPATGLLPNGMALALCPACEESARRRYGHR